MRETRAERDCLFRWNLLNRNEVKGTSLFVVERIDIVVGLMRKAIPGQNETNMFVAEMFDREEVFKGRTDAQSCV